MFLPVREKGNNLAMKIEIFMFQDLFYIINLFIRDLFFTIFFTYTDKNPVRKPWNIRKIYVAEFINIELFTVR